MFATITNELPVTAAEIAGRTKKDSLLVKIHEYTSSGWPGSCLSPDHFGIVETSFHWKMGVCCGAVMSSYHLIIPKIFTGRVTRVPSRDMPDVSAPVLLTKNKVNAMKKLAFSLVRITLNIRKVKDVVSDACDVDLGSVLVWVKSE